MRNAGLNFVCRTVPLTVENSQSLFTASYNAGERIDIARLAAALETDASSGSLSRSAR